MTSINSSIKPFSAMAFKNGEFILINEQDVIGKWAVFFFYPADFTFVCPTELGDLADHYSELQARGVEVYSVSTDTHFTHKAWHESSDTIGKIQYPMIGDPSGAKLSGNLVEHMNRYPISIRENIRVESISGDHVRTIALNTGEQIQTRSIIVATGAQWRKLGIPGEEENIGAGVAYCPHCDGPFFAGKDVVVVGGGNSGIEAALDLAGIVRSVTVVEFMPTLKADKVLVDQAKQRTNISIIANAAYQEIIADGGKVVALEYLDRVSNTRKRLNTDGVFVQIGLSPNSQFVSDIVECTAHGEIIVDNKCRTTQANVFAAGDVTTVPYKKIVIAMGEGAKAALSAFEYLLAHPAHRTDIEKQAA